MKKLLLRINIFILLIASFCIVFAKNNVFAEDYEIESYKINATVEETGTIHMEEYIKYNFSEDMNGLYRDILYSYIFNNQEDTMEATSSRYQADSIENISVYTSDTSFDNMDNSTLKDESLLSNGMSHVYSVQNLINNGYRTKIKVYSPVKEDSSKYVKYVYDIYGATVKYNDAGEIYWNFVGKDWKCSINNLTVNIAFESNIDLSKIKVYPHSYSNISGASINGNVLTFTDSNISSGTAVDARIVFPVEAIKYQTDNIKENYDYAKLEELENKMVINKENYTLSNKILLYIILFAIIGFIYIIVKSIKNSNKNLPKNKEIEYYTDILDNYSLGEYSTLYSRITSFSNSNLIIATILDLSNKKYIKMESLKKVKKVFGEPEYDYYLTIDKTKNVNKLTEYEKLVINFLFDKTTENLDSLENVKTDKIELNKAFKETSTKFSLISSFQKKCAQFTKEYTEKFYRKSSGGLYKKLFLYIVMVLAAISINTIFVSPLYINAKFITIIVSSVILLFNSIILLLIIYNCSFIIRDEYVNEYKMLKGLKKYLDDYSLIKDRYPIEIALWDRYLVFASLLGIAPKVAKEFKEELIKNGYDDNYIYTYYPILNMSMNSAVITASAGASTGSAGSGGYSGGGGGGRRWWRRRCLLNLKI
jgi:uncharacterized membrane protein